MIPDGLLRIARGEVLADEWSRKVYSVDASDYEIEPAAVAFPKDGCDLQEICR